MDNRALGTYIGLVLFLFMVRTISAQNFVKNPSFEVYVNCPERLGNFDSDVKSWSTPTEGSTDYFNACSSAMGTPKNFNGSQRADFGSGYAGLYLYAPDDYREYLQAELSSTLEAGRTYRISFFVSLAERSDFAIKEFGVLLANNPLEISTKKELSKKLLYGKKNNQYNYLEIGYTNFYADTQDWILVSTQFVAKGTERFLIIGNFKKNARTRLFKTKRNAKQGAYYYIDMLSVVLVTDSEVTSTGEKNGSDDQITGFELNTTHVFKDVLFDFDKYRLDNRARNELQKIYSYLTVDSTLTIIIEGHTDSVGSKSYNDALSSKRAKAVANYLLGLGLSKNVSRGGGEVVLHP